MKAGNPDSKYAYSPEKLDYDVAAKECEHRQFIDTVKKMVMSDPSKIDLRYYDLIVALTELKNEHSL